MTRASSATYVFALVVNRTTMRPPHPSVRLPGAGAVRLVAVKPTWSLVCCDVPMHGYGDAALQARLSNLDWVSTVAMVHERVVAHFLAADAVLPMKLFTIFLADDRARADVLTREPEIHAVVKRVTRREEWGVRMATRHRPEPLAGTRATRHQVDTSGVEYLMRKKAQRDEALSHATLAREAASDLFDRLASLASEARRRPVSHLAPGTSPVILDATFLVPRTRASRLRAAAARQARALAADGIEIDVTGPWPPYSFVQD